MKKYLIAVFALWVITNTIAVNAELITVENTDFVSAPANFNKFEKIGLTADLSSKKSNSESNVELIGVTSKSKTDTPYINGQGRYGRYENESGISNTQSLHLSR